MDNDNDNANIKNQEFIDYEIQEYTSKDFLQEIYSTAIILVEQTQKEQENIIPTNEECMKDSENFISNIFFKE